MYLIACKTPKWSQSIVTCANGANGYYIVMYIVATIFIFMFVSDYDVFLAPHADGDGMQSPHSSGTCVCVCRPIQHTAYEILLFCLFGQLLLLSFFFRIASHGTHHLRCVDCNQMFLVGTRAILNFRFKPNFIQKRSKF